MESSNDHNKPGENINIIVVGGGPAGVQAAMRARELGAQVTLLESERLGGTAFNKGPAPVLTLARATRLRADTSLFSTFGLVGDPPSVNLVEAIQKANRVAAHANEVWELTKVVRGMNIVEVEEVGPTRFVDTITLEIEDGRKFTGNRIILAVGGTQRKLTIPGNELGLTFHDLWELEELPEKVTVVGGSATGC